MRGSVHFKTDRQQWVVAWTWQGKRYQISRYKGRLMVQTHPNKNKDQGYVDACRLLAQMQGDVENGVFRIEKYIGKRYTDVIPFFEQWLETKRNLKPATLKLYKSMFDCHIRPYFETHPVQLHEIQLDTLDALLASIKLGRSSAHLCMQCFHAFLDYCARSKRIESVPPFPKKSEYGIETPAIKWLTEERQMAVIKAIPEEHRPIFLFLKYHLRRPAEAMSLHKIDYDRFNKAFHIRRSISAGILVTSTKTRAEHIIPCHRAMIDTVEKLVDENTESPFLFVNRTSRSAGKRYSEKSLARIWKCACGVVGESIDLYSGMKHSSMSQFVNEKRLSMAELQIISGHAKIESVYKYASVELARKRELMETVSLVEPEKMRRTK